MRVSPSAGASGRGLTPRRIGRFSRAAMAGEDLISLPGLRDKHRKILDERLGITTYDGLLGTDAQVIFEAVSRVRPRTSLAVIRRWQDVARRKRKEAVVETPDWEPAAVFVPRLGRRPV